MAIPTLDIQGLDPSLEGITFSLTGQGGQKLSRNIRRGNSEFRNEFTALGISEDTPFQLRVENPQGSTSGQQSNLLAQLLGGSGIQAPSTPDFYTTPEGTYRKVNGGYVFEEDPAKRKLRLEREALISTLLSQVEGGVSPERVAQINQKADLLGENLFERAEKLLRQTEKQRGREGSPLADGMINLAQETAERAQLFAEDLQERDRQATLSALNAVQLGADAAQGRALQGNQLASNDIYARQALETNSAQNLLSTLLGADIQNRSLSLQERGLTEQLQLAELARRDKEKESSRGKLTSLGNIGGTVLGAAIPGGGLFNTGIKRGIQVIPSFLN